MSGRTDYIPGPDLKFLHWAQSFRDTAAANPERYMLSQADVTAITRVVNDFSTMFAIASNEQRRTTPNIAAKDAARYTCEALLRRYAVTIKHNDGIDDGDKVGLGVRPLNVSRKPIEPPATYPLLNILGNTPGSQTLRVADATTPDSRAKPFAVSGLELYRCIGDERPAPLSACHYYGLFTRTTIAVEFSEEDDAKSATYYGRWINAKGEPGPWSLPVCMTIAA